MTSTIAASRALAIEIRDEERDELLGIAVLLPSENTRQSAQKSRLIRNEFRLKARARMKSAR